MAGTTNLLQWNPTAVNQETDAAYAADSQRAGGATNPSLFDATLANKLFYQLSTYMSALFQAFADKGFTTSDSNVSTLTAQCLNFLTTADILPAVVDVSYASSVTLNAAIANGFYLQGIAGPLNIAGVTGLTAGQLVALYYQQDATGGRVVTFSSLFVGAQTPDPSANAVSVQLFGYDAVTGKLRACTPIVSGTGSYFPALVTTQALTLASGAPNGYVLTGNGSSFVALPFALATLSNSYGSYRLAPDGTLECWGSVTVGSTGSAFANATVTFPHAYTTAPVLTLSVVGQPRAGRPDVPAVNAISTTTTGASLALQCSVPTGGGGATFDQALAVNFYAIGS